MKVQTNLSAMNAYRMHSDTTRKLSKTTERLSSGYKINRAGDDAAGLTISENMRREIRGLKQASSNCQDGISFSQIADGALGEVNDMIHRSKELAVKASNGTLTDADREAVQSEMTEIMKEIDRVSESTQFNTIEIFPKEGHSPDELTVASEGANSFTVENSFIMGGTKVNVAASQEIGQDTAYADSDMAQFIVSAASNAIKKIEAAYPNLMGTAESKTVNIGLKIGNIDGKGNTLASAQVSLFSRDGKQMAAYTMNVDKIDYPLSKFSSMSDAQKADLAAVVAHEMTHIVMYDTTTKGMLNGDIPKWFVEGMAQTSSGDNGWVSNKISSTSTNEAIKNYMSQLSSMPYGAGYLATMYLGQLASGSATVSSANIKTGLDKILQQLANGKSLDDAIKLETSLSGGQAEFENKFKTGDASALGFVKDLLTERGSGAVLFLRQIFLTVRQWYLHLLHLIKVLTIIL